MAKNKKVKDTTEKSGGGSKKFILILIIALLIVGGGVGGGVYFLMKDKAGTNVKTVVAIKEAYFDLDEYVVNLAGDENSNKFLKIKFKVGYDSANTDLATELTELQPILRSIGLEFLHSKKQEDFGPASNAKDEHSLEITKKQLIEQLNKKITKGRFIEVYIQDLVIQ